MLKFPRAVMLAVAFTVAAACNSPTRPTPQPPPPPALGIACPGNVSASAAVPAGVTVSFGAATSSGGQAPVQVSCTRQSGSLFAQGTTPVQCTATDAAGQSASCTFNVTVTFTIVTPQLTRTKFLAFGDSITAGEVSFPINAAARGGGSNYKQIVVPVASYPQQLQNRLRERYVGQTSLITVTNAGLPSETAQNGRTRLRSVLSSTPAEVVIILEGYNELTNIVPGAIAAAELAILGMVRETKVTGARVLLGTLTPPRPGGQRTVPADRVLDLNARIRAIAIAEGVPLVDFYAGMVNDVQRYIGVDGLHPNEAGYERMAELVLATIRAELEQR
jgi:lysophospholipase L1-like esterase